jgi:hypothetical protein
VAAEADREQDRTAAIADGIASDHGEIQTLVKFMKMRKGEERREMQEQCARQVSVLHERLTAGLAALEAAGDMLEEEVAVLQHGSRETRGHVTFAPPPSPAPAPAPAAPAPAPSREAAERAAAAARRVVVPDSLAFLEGLGGPPPAAAARSPARRGGGGGDLEPAAALALLNDEIARAQGLLGPRALLLEEPEAEARPGEEEEEYEEGGCRYTSAEYAAAEAAEEAAAAAGEEEEGAAGPAADPQMAELLCLDGALGRELAALDQRYIGQLEQLRAEFEAGLPPEVYESERGGWPKKPHEIYRKVTKEFSRAGEGRGAGGVGRAKQQFLERLGLELAAGGFDAASGFGLAELEAHDAWHDKHRFAEGKRRAHLRSWRAEKRALLEAGRLRMDAAAAAALEELERAVQSTVDTGGGGGLPFFLTPLSFIRRTRIGTADGAE